MSDTLPTSALDIDPGYHEMPLFEIARVADNPDDPSDHGWRVTCGNWTLCSSAAILDHELDSYGDDARVRHIGRWSLAHW